MNTHDCIPPCEWLALPSQTLIIGGTHLQRWPLLSISCLIVLAILAIISPCALAQSLDRPVAKPPSPELEQAVVKAFSDSHGGYSVDEILLEDARRSRFVEATNEHLERVKLATANADEVCAALLHVRKAGGRLPKSKQRAKETPVQLRSGGAVSEDSVLAIAEIAARQLGDHLGEHVDAVLVSNQAREFFDSRVTKLVDVTSTYAFRKAALRLRKTRRLEPELLSRVTDWKRRIEVYSVTQLVDDASAVPQLPGVYLFRDHQGYAYIGQASDLRARLETHVTDSDRFALAEWLASESLDSVQVEVHVFQSGSPGEKLAVRRAYESELIRTRKPRLNLAP